MNTENVSEGLSLEDFMKQYGTEAQCEDAFAQACWPNLGGGTQQFPQLIEN